MNAALLAFSALILLLEFGGCDAIQDYASIAADVYAGIKMTAHPESTKRLALKATLQYLNLSLMIHKQTDDLLSELSAEIVSLTTVDSMEDVFQMLAQMMSQASMEISNAHLLPILEHCIISWQKEGIYSCSEMTTIANLCGHLQTPFHLVIDSFLVALFASYMEELPPENNLLLVLAKKYSVLTRRLFW